MDEVLRKASASGPCSHASREVRKESMIRSEASNEIESSVNGGFDCGFANWGIKYVQQV